MFDRNTSIFAVDRTSLFRDGCLAVISDVKWVRICGRNLAIKLSRFHLTKLELWRHYVPSVSIGAMEGNTVENQSNPFRSFTSLEPFPGPIRGVSPSRRAINAE